MGLPCFLIGQPCALWWHCAPLPTRRIVASSSVMTQELEQPLAGRKLILRTCARNAGALSTFKIYLCAVICYMITHTIFVI